MAHPVLSSRHLPRSGHRSLHLPRRPGMSNPTPTADERVNTGPQASQSVKAAVAERGAAYNYKTDTDRFPNLAVWKECMYVRHGEPDCLIGVSLARYGVPIAAIQEIENAKGRSNFCDNEDGDDCVEIMCGEEGIHSPWLYILLAQIERAHV